MKKRLHLNASTELYLVLLLAVVLALLGVFAKGFYDVNNLMSILNRFSYILIAAIGMNLIIITSNIDVSAGALVSVICIIVAFVGKLGVGFWGLLIIAMISGMILSTINALVISKLKIPSIVATLAMALIYQGALPLLSGGSIYDLPESFTWLAFKAKLFGIIPASFLIAVVVAVIAILFMHYSKYSKKLYAIGNNINGARLAGINVDVVVILSFTIAGLLYGITGVIIATASQRVTPTMANGMEMMFIAAVVLGGTSTMGGSGRVLGTVFGSLILAIVGPAINFVGISPDWSNAVTGLIIIISVISTTFERKKKRVFEDMERAGK